MHRYMRSGRPGSVRLYRAALGAAFAAPCAASVVAYAGGSPTRLAIGVVLTLLVTLGLVVIVTRVAWQQRGGLADLIFALATIGCWFAMVPVMLGAGPVIARGNDGTPGRYLDPLLPPLLIATLTILVLLLTALACFFAVRESLVAVGTALLATFSIWDFYVIGPPNSSVLLALIVIDTLCWVVRAQILHREEAGGTPWTDPPLRETTVDRTGGPRQVRAWMSLAPWLGNLVLVAIGATQCMMVSVAVRQVLHV